LFGRCRVNAKGTKWSKNALIKEIGRLCVESDLMEVVNAREGGLMVQILVCFEKVNVIGAN
jgi:hypothetical protein